MTAKDYLNYVVKEIHTTIVATVDDEGFPVTAAIDMMDTDGGSCVAVCPQMCILTDSIPYVIEQKHCLHCGNCLTACPVSAVERGGARCSADIGLVPTKVKRRQSYE